MLKTPKEKVKQLMYLPFNPNLHSVNYTVEDKKDFKPHLFVKVPVKIVVQWDILKNNVLKDQEKLVQNSQTKKLQQMM